MEKHLKVERQFRFEISNPESTATKLLVVLHGYGHLARYFIRKFQILSDDFLIVAPEGMHRFYLKGESGKVGASWMTKEDRLIDIEDNVHYLNQLLSHIKKTYPSITEVHLLGFSQGGATAARWAGMGSVKLKSIVLWACVFPPDMENIGTMLQENKYFILGDKDEYFMTSELQSTWLSHYEKLGYQTKTYEGVHDIDSNVLRKVYDIILE